MNKQGNKKTYNKRVLKNEDGTFTPMFLPFMEVWRRNVVLLCNDYPMYC